MTAAQAYCIRYVHVWTPSPTWPGPVCKKHESGKSLCDTASTCHQQYRLHVTGCQYATVMQLWDLRVAVGKSLSTHLPSSWLGIGEVATPLRISGNAQICAHQQHLYSSNTIAAATLFQLATAMHALKYAKCQPLAFAFTFTSCQYDRSPIPAALYFHSLPSAPQPPLASRTACWSIQHLTPPVQASMLLLAHFALHIAHWACSVLGCVGKYLTRNAAAQQMTRYTSYLGISQARLRRSCKMLSNLRSMRDDLANYRYLWNMWNAASWLGELFRIQFGVDTIKTHPIAFIKPIYLSPKSNKKPVPLGPNVNMKEKRLYPPFRVNRARHFCSTSTSYSLQTLIIDPRCGCLRW